MKLQKTKIKRKDDPNFDKYSKWSVIIPPDSINQLGWKEGSELIAEINNGLLCLRLAREDEILKNKEKSYIKFKENIEKILLRFPAGLSWYKINQKLSLKRPPKNQWIKKLEKDISLKRIKRDGETIWLIEYNCIFIIEEFLEHNNLEQFIKNLKDNAIQLLINIGGDNLNRSVNNFEDKLKNELECVGIMYKGMPELNPPPELEKSINQDSNNEQSLDSYKTFLKKNPEVMESVSDIEGRARRKKTVLFFPRDYKYGPRKTITDELKRRGWKINQLILNQN